jgi:hypothetical protein
MIAASRFAVQNLEQMIKRPSRVGAGLILFVALLLACAYFPVRARADSSGCATTSTQNVKSPDGKWNAVTSEGYCQNGIMSLGTYNVTLVNALNPSTNKLIFVVIDEGAVTRPKVSWSGNTTLKINTIHPVGTNLQESSYSGISIVYTYRLI